MIKDADLFAIYGRRGSGKTTAALHLIRKRKRVVAFDPNGEFTGKGWTVAETRSAVLDAMRRGWRRGFKVSYSPEPGTEIEALHWIANMLWAAQVNYPSGGCPNEVTLLIEEAHTALPVSQLPSDRAGMYRLIRQGRHRGIEAIAVTQRPASLSPDFRTNAIRSYVFPLGDTTSRNTVTDMLGPQHREAVRDLQKFEYLLSDDGTVSKGKTTKQGRLVPRK